MSGRAGRLAALLAAAALGLTACGESPAPAAGEWAAMEPTGSLELEYAEQFTADYYEGGLSLVTIAGQDRFLVVPEGGHVPTGLEPDIAVLQQPLDSIYLAATSAMDLFRAIDGLDSLRLSGTRASGWYIPEAVEAMEAGDLLYAGKYNAPDYELILSEHCDLAVESTMIYHDPAVKEQLERLGVPVLVERSSYESHPLGRMEWVKLYGLLLGREEEAAACFARETDRLETVLGGEPTGKTVAFFYITSNGTANVRRPGDYVAKVIELAGGEYIFHDLPSPDNALSTLNMQMEDFYVGAREADCLIYNSAIDGELQTLDQLFGKSSLLRDFRAVQEGNVWCTGKNLFQESMGLAGLMEDIHGVLTGQTDELNYLHRLT